MATDPREGGLGYSAGLAVKSPKCKGKNVTTLITGAGLIGCLTADLLVRSGVRVVMLDRAPNVDHIASVLPVDEVAIEVGDIRDRDRLFALISGHGVTHVIHTAAALSMSIRREPALAAEVNLGGTVNVLEAARNLGLQRVVCASSTTVYYPVFHRRQEHKVSEDFSFHSVSERPGSLYAASKLAGEFFAQHYAEHYGVDVVTLRYSAVLGLWAGPNYSVPGRLVAELLGQGARGGHVHIRDPLLMWSGGEDFIDAREVARANVAALRARELPSRVYNIASGEMATFANFVDAARTVNPRFVITHDEIPQAGFAGFAYPRDVAFDVGLAHRELGFRARHDLVDSFRAALPWVDRG